MAHQSNVAHTHTYPIVKQLILLIVLAHLPMHAHAGNCTYRTDRAKDGSYCGERSAEARQSGYEPIIYAPTPQPSQPQFNPYFYPATEQEATEFRDYFHTHTANWDNAKKHQTLAWLKAQFAEQKGAAYAERVVSLVELPPLPAAIPEPAQTQIQTTQPQPTQPQPTQHHTPITPAKQTPKSNSNSKEKVLFFTFFISLLILLSKPYMKKIFSSTWDIWFGGAIFCLFAVLSYAIGAWVFLVLFLAWLGYGFFQSDNNTQQTVKPPPAQPKPKTTPTRTPNTNHINAAELAQLREKQQQAEKMEKGKAAFQRLAHNLNTNPQFAQAMHRAIEKATALNPPSIPKVPHPNPMSAQENLANWEHLKKQGNDVSNDIIAALRLASEKEKRVGIGTEPQPTAPSTTRQIAESIAKSLEQQAKQSSIDHNQAELDRWRNKRYGKSDQHKAELGKRYEQYIGYLYEQKGYTVQYHGIEKGKEDLGIDLIAKKGNKVLIIQAKCWSKKRHIYHDTITQIAGAALLYHKRHGKPNQTIRAVVITSTTLDENQKRVAQDLGVFVLEKIPYNRNYPAIKCKANKAEGTFIYHLPTDQQYDKIIIRPENGDCYAQTTFEAEFKGFRRAYRWSGNQS